MPGTTSSLVSLANAVFLSNVVLSNAAGAVTLSSAAGRLGVNVAYPLYGVDVASTVHVAGDVIAEGGVCARGPGGLCNSGPGPLWNAGPLSNVGNLSVQGGATLVGVTQTQGGLCNSGTLWNSGPLCNAGVVAACNAVFSGTVTCTSVLLVTGTALTASLSNVGPLAASNATFSGPVLASASLSVAGGVTVTSGGLCNCVAPLWTQGLAVGPGSSTFQGGATTFQGGSATFQGATTTFQGGSATFQASTALVTHGLSNLGPLWTAALYTPSLTADSLTTTVGAVTAASNLTVQSGQVLLGVSPDAAAAAQLMATYQALRLYAVISLEAADLFGATTGTGAGPVSAWGPFLSLGVPTSPTFDPLGGLLGTAGRNPSGAGAGAAGGAVVFSASASNRMVLGTQAGIPARITTNGGICMACVARWDAPLNPMARLCQLTTASIHEFIVLTSQTALADVRLNNTDMSDSTGITPPLAAGQWHLYGMRYSATTNTVTFSIDGVLVFSRALLDAPLADQVFTTSSELGTSSYNPPGASGAIQALYVWEYYVADALWAAATAYFLSGGAGVTKPPRVATRVGILAPTPLYTLDVNGTARVAQTITLGPNRVTVPPATYAAAVSNALLAVEAADLLTSAADMAPVVTWGPLSQALSNNPPAFSLASSGATYSSSSGQTASQTIGAAVVFAATSSNCMRWVGAAQPGTRGGITAVVCYSGGTPASPQQRLLSLASASSQTLLLELTRGGGMTFGASTVSSGSGQDGAWHTCGVRYSSALAVVTGWLDGVAVGSLSNVSPSLSDQSVSVTLGGGPPAYLSAAVSAAYVWDSYVPDAQWAAVQAYLASGCAGITKGVTSQVTLAGLGSNLGVNQATPAWAVDATGDLNCTGALRTSGVARVGPDGSLSSSAIVNAGALCNLGSLYVACNTTFGGPLSIANLCNAGTLSTCNLVVSGQSFLNGTLVLTSGLCNNGTFFTQNLSIPGTFQACNATFPGNLTCGSFCNSGAFSLASLTLSGALANTSSNSAQYVSACSNASGSTYAFTVCNGVTSSNLKPNTVAHTWFNNGGVSPCNLLLTLDTVGSLVAQGNISANGELYAKSDARLKTALRPISGALERLHGLTGYTYERVDDDDNDGGQREKRRHTGLLAQDVLAVLPEAVDTTSAPMMSVAYGNLAGMFTEAIKEVSYTTAVLADRMASVLARLDALEDARR